MLLRCFGIVFCLERNVCFDLKFCVLSFKCVLFNRSGSWGKPLQKGYLRIIKTNVGTIATLQTLTCALQQPFSQPWTLERHLVGCGDGGKLLKLWLLLYRNTFISVWWLFVITSITHIFSPVYQWHLSLFFSFCVNYAWIWKCGHFSPQVTKG